MSRKQGLSAVLRMRWTHDHIHTSTEVLDREMQEETKNRVELSEVVNIFYAYDLYCLLFLRIVKKR